MYSRCIQTIESEASSSNLSQAEKNHSIHALFLKKSKIKKHDRKYIFKQFTQLAKMNKRIIVMN